MDELLRVERDGASNSSSSQALAVKEIRSERQRRSGKGLRDEGVKGLGKKGRRRGMDGVRGQVALRRSVSVNLPELWRVLETNVESDEESFMKGGGSRPGV